MPQDSYDVIVVGAGLARSACALTLARNGVRVCLCERGAWPGEKSLSGMILYGRQLADLIPAQEKSSPALASRVKSESPGGLRFSS